MMFATRSFQQRRQQVSSALVLVLFLFASPAALAISIPWVPVGDAGNAADTTGFGAVSDPYQISKFEITNTEYAEFLNAVAAADPNGLYHSSMGSDSLGGITRTGASESYTYSAKPSLASHPVNFVSFYDALRMANWLHNGQPTGAQGNATTENGAYTITAQGINDNSIIRNSGARFALPTTDELYKAAFYDALSLSYFEYPAGTSSQIGCGAPSAAPNQAVCDTFFGPFQVGSATASASPYGTFDQGGNVDEWTEDNDTLPTGTRGTAGSLYFSVATDLAASEFGGAADPTNHDDFQGFRLVLVPEPGAGMLLLQGVLGLAWIRSARRHVSTRSE